MSDKLQSFLDAAGKQAEFDVVAAASACTEDCEKILKLVAICKAFAAVVEAAKNAVDQRRLTYSADQFYLRESLKAADAAVAAHLKEVGE